MLRERRLVFAIARSCGKQKSKILRVCAHHFIAAIADGLPEASRREAFDGRSALGVSPMWQLGDLQH